MTLATLSFKTEFAVDMTCQNCVDAVSEALHDVPGIERYDIDLSKKQVTIIGRTPPSHLLSALKATHRQVIVRGSSSASPSSQSQAAVSILESPLPIPSSVASTSFPALAGENPERALPGMNEAEFTQKVFGICRFVQIAPKLVLMDLTVRLPPLARVGLGLGERYDVYISSTGNMISPPETTGKPYLRLGQVKLDEGGYGDMFREVEGELWEWIGRGCIVQAASAISAEEKVKIEATPTSTIGKIFAGVVARSAGVWGNDKTVCACSGRTMWEEGREMELKSML
ncbi:hypothetical protein TREMEDRAFT_71208 [Tremella mesenterica DSM 1558]|uniref:uncharacterized protein n=1 Tax=Tremella mesenterica (strain ATCC 24925 / CBS 8224 / DSM 1558 / NBRC 9311 / NRRL Y-6157 / RJB 2259-6 / UBC 559-6) TaxID=578456 RepID=UPI0003F491C4|nr:uncharacterized protein TREMEDRAFT_71208 [Tremella mesenterica DSM 1558]EIW71591.1 hypothetical protein TREMEDRAFT_71208 [Tremella mesenterica DSM 1558]